MKDVLSSKEIIKEKGKRTQVIMNHTGKSEGPFTRIQADFIEIPVCNGLRYVLVIVCLFSKWVEGYPPSDMESIGLALCFRLRLHL